MSGSPCQGIWFSACFPWPEHNLEIELGQELGTPGLPTIQEFGCCEVLQVLLVSHDFDRVASILEFGSPFFECPDDG